MLVLLVLAAPLHAELVIDIREAGLKRMPIALPPFVDLSSRGEFMAGNRLGQQLVGVITSDLERSGLFRAIDPRAFMQDSATLWQSGPNYRVWRQLNAEAILSGAIQQNGDELTASFFLYDTFQGKLFGKGKRFSAPLKDIRHLAHRISDEIYSRLTGESGYFSSRIAFIAQKGRHKWLAMMDQDGANRLDLTYDANHLVLTPRFSPNGENLFYISYETNQPRIFRWLIYQGKRIQQGEYPGLNSAPSWSPDGRYMAMTLTKDGNAEIYVKDLQTNNLARLTHDNAIDTSPSWSPDGRRIVFNSDRAGSPQIYTMNVDGSNVRRITFEGRYNSAPAWSPRGDLITYVKGGDGHFRIAVTDPSGNRSRTLTNSWMDESPTWSPNGRVILFSRQSGDLTRLYTIDLTGHNEQAVPVGDSLGGSDPSWSPLIR
ncbi:MAG: Tol-Pal system beta propeller repeat protein TolB [Magnetococcus sp. DMHC-1]|nr:Tol-Pal system protein TolB [Magnetococcales bacterium]MBF0155049.1 Tol-Pal system protein TolB [Magnetococcales bacterium]